MRVIPRNIENGHELLSSASWPETSVLARTLYDFMMVINHEYSADDERRIEEMNGGGSPL